MGSAYAEIGLINGADRVLLEMGQITEAEVRRVTLRAHVDSGADLMCINEQVNGQLQLRERGRLPATLADGWIADLALVGPLEVVFENRRANVDALVLPSDAEVLLGAIPMEYPMEYMDVLIDPRRRLVVNPEHPYRAQVRLA